LEDEQRPKPYKFIRFGEIHGPKPYKFILFGDSHGLNTYKFKWFANWSEALDHANFRIQPR
jgi:hypothetical protein